MIRIVEKLDGSQVIQTRVQAPDFGQNGIISGAEKYEWQDVPVVREFQENGEVHVVAENPKKDIQYHGRVIEVEGNKCLGVNGSQFELKVQHTKWRNTEDHWHINDMVYSPVLPGIKILVKDFKVLDNDTVRYIFQLYGIDSNSYLPNDVFKQNPELVLYHTLNNEVVSFGYGKDFSHGYMEVRHFRNRNSEKAFDRWKVGDIVSNMFITDVEIKSIHSMYNIVKYSVVGVGGDRINVKVSDQLSITNPNNTALQFGEFILNQIEGLHCRNVAGWFKEFMG